MLCSPRAVFWARLAPFFGLASRRFLGSPRAVFWARLAPFFGLASRRFFGLASRRFLGSPRAVFWARLAPFFGLASRRFLGSPRAVFWARLAPFFGLASRRPPALSCWRLCQCRADFTCSDWLRSSSNSRRFAAIGLGLPAEQLVGASDAVRFRGHFREANIHRT